MDKLVKNLVIENHLTQTMVQFCANLKKIANMCSYILHLDLKHFIYFSHFIFFSFFSFLFSPPPLL